MKTNEASKPALPAPSAGEKGKESDGEELAAPKATAKAGLLPTGLSRAIVIGSVLLVLTGGVVGLFGSRYTLVSALRSENAIVYRIDRMTGRVSFCSPVACVAVPEKSESAN